MPNPDSFTTTEGSAPFPYPTALKSCSTYYKILNPSLSSTSTTKPPLIAIHGGPGATHHMFTSFSHFTVQYHIPIIFYDQLGCGSSTHLPEKAGDETFWNEDLFVAELYNLIAYLKLATYDVIGVSWGGMLASRFASTKPKGLRRLVISNAPADLKIRYEIAERYRKELPEDVQAVLKEHEEAGTTSSKEYGEAFAVFSKRHILSLSPLPAELARSAEESAKDRTVALTMSGKERFESMGSLRGWSMVGEARKIGVPTLLVNGEKEIMGDECVMPFWREIQKVKWVKFAGSKHAPWLEEPERFFRIVGEFLCDE